MTDQLNCSNYSSSQVP